MKKEIKRVIWGAAMAMICSTANAQLTCTPTPDCASLGYNKTASQCQHGGVKCPFDANKMFCLKNSSAFNFQLKTAATLYNVVYSDGTHSSAYSYKANNPAIGVIGFIYANTSNMNGMIVSKEQPISGTFQEAVEYCNLYSIVGTNPGDWRLPTAVEALQTMGSSNFVNNGGQVTNRWNTINGKLVATRRGDSFGISYSSGYRNATNSAYPDYDTNANFNMGNVWANGGGMINQYTYWTSNDCYSTVMGTQGRLIILNVTNGIGTCAAKNTKRLFRCVMDF